MLLGEVELSIAPSLDEGQDSSALDFDVYAPLDEVELPLASSLDSDLIFFGS